MASPWLTEQETLELFLRHSVIESRFRRSLRINISVVRKLVAAKILERETWSRHRYFGEVRGEDRMFLIRLTRRGRTIAKKRCADG